MEFTFAVEADSPSSRERSPEGAFVLSFLPAGGAGAFCNTKQALASFEQTQELYPVSCLLAVMHDTCTGAAEEDTTGAADEVMKSPDKMSRASPVAIGDCKMMPRRRKDSLFMHILLQIK